MTYDELDDRGSIYDLQGRVDWDTGRCENNLSVLLYVDGKWELWYSSTGLAGFSLLNADLGDFHASMYSHYKAVYDADPNREKTVTFTSKFRR